jgi:predicted kinase
MTEQGGLSIEAALASLNPEPGLTVLMCGVAGSGKTTFSQALETKGFHRISIDEEIWRTFGRYGIDYPAEAYPDHVAATRAAIGARLDGQLALGAATVVDSAFWARSHRDDFKALIEGRGRPWRLIYLRTPETVLRARLADRARRFDANAAFPIDAERLQTLLEGFQEPVGEGETVVDVLADGLPRSER